MHLQIWQIVLLLLAHMMCPHLDTFIDFIICSGVC